MRHRLDVDGNAGLLGHFLEGDRKLRTHCWAVGGDERRLQAIRETGFREQLLGFRDILLSLFGSLEELVGRVQRRVVARRAKTFGNEVDHRLAIDRERDRTADARVVERRGVATEVDVAELAGRRAQDLDAVIAVKPQVFGRLQRRDDVDIAGDHRRAFGGDIREYLDFDTIEIRACRVVIVRVAFDDDQAVRLVGYQLERAGAHSLGGKVLRSPVAIEAGMMRALV